METLFTLTLKKIITDTPSYAPAYSLGNGCHPQIIQIYCPECISQKRNILQFLDDIKNILRICLSCPHKDGECTNNTHKLNLHTFDLEKLAKLILEHLQYKESTFYKNKRIYVHNTFGTMIWDATTKKCDNWKLFMLIDTIKPEQYYINLVLDNIDITNVDSLEKEIIKLYKNIPQLYEREPKKYMHIYKIFTEYKDSFVSLMIIKNIQYNHNKHVKRNTYPAPEPDFNY